MKQHNLTVSSVAILRYNCCLIVDWYHGITRRMAGRTWKIHFVSIWFTLIPIISIIIYIHLYTSIYDRVKLNFATQKGDWKAILEYFSDDAKHYGNSQTVTILYSDIKMKLRERITDGKTEPLLTLFTTWNDSSEKFLVHNNTVQNWLSFRPFVIPVIFTNEASVASACRRNGWEVLPVRVTAADDVPVLKFMYIDAMKTYKSTFYAYSNSDILFTGALVDTLIGCAYNLSDSMDARYSLYALEYEMSLYAQQPTMIVGQRTNVVNVTKSESSTWTGITSVAKKGELFSDNAEDYFITTRSYPWTDAAEVVIGRRAYDNWLVYNALKQKHIVIDGTSTILAVHQTTASGNFEGHKHRNKDYNADLLKQLYKNIIYTYGNTGCAKYETQYRQVHVVVTNRNVTKWYCPKHKHSVI